MREENIALVKKHFLSNPKYKYSLEDLKANMLSIGISEQEFEEAVRQLTGAPTRPSTQTPVQKIIPHVSMPVIANSDQQDLANKFFSSKRLLELDIATHVAVLLILLLGGLLVGYVFLMGGSNNSASTHTGEPVAQIRTAQKSLVPQIYANVKPVNASQIFSYPASNITLAVTGTPKKDVLGFFPYWMLDEQDKISLNGITQVALFGLEVDGKGNIVTSDSTGQPDGGWSMWNGPTLDQFIRRAKQRRVKILLTIKAFSNDNIDKLVASDDSQKHFISNAIQLMDSKSLDGLNLDFEYVGDVSDNSRNGFSRLVTNLRAEMSRQFPNATLTIDSYINSAAIPRLLDVEALAPQIDAFVVMGYDMHTPLGQPGPIAPMEGDVSIIGYMQSYLEKIAPEKLILAVPYYGYDWVVPNTTDQNADVIPYAEIAANKIPNIQWDDTTQSPWYQYKEPGTNLTREVHFENPRSLGIKYDYVNRKNLRGIAIWALGYDGLNADLRQVILEKFAN